MNCNKKVLLRGAALASLIVASYLQSANAAEPAVPTGAYQIVHGTYEVTNADGSIQKNADGSITKHDTMFAYRTNTNMVQMLILSQKDGVLQYTWQNVTPNP